MFILSSSRAKVNKSTYQMNRNEEVNILIKYHPYWQFPYFLEAWVLQALFRIQQVTMTMFVVTRENTSEMNILAVDWRKLCVRLQMGVSWKCFVYLQHQTNSLSRPHEADSTCLNEMNCCRGWRCKVWIYWLQVPSHHCISWNTHVSLLSSET